MSNSGKYEEDSLLASESDDLFEIHQAIIDDDAEKLDELCKQGVKNLNGKFTDDLDPQHINMTPLALSAALNKEELVQVLLKHGAEIDATFANLKTTALMTSSFHGHSSMVKLLLDGGADVKKTDVQRSTSLGYCFGGSRSESVVTLLLRAGTDVNISNVLGMNAFLLVSGYGNEKLLRMVLGAGAKAKEAVNNFGHTPVHLCVLGKQSQIDSITARGRYGTAHFGLQRKNLKSLLLDWATANQSDLPNGFVPDRSFEQVGQLMEDLGGKITSLIGGGGEDDDDEALWSEEEIMRRKIDVASKYRREKLERTASLRKSGFIDSFLYCGGKLGSRQNKGPAGQQKGAFDFQPVHEPPPPLDEEREAKVKVLCENFSRSLRALVDAGCLVDESEYTFGLTALDVAILNGDVESAAILLSSGADANHLMKMLSLTELYPCLAGGKMDKKRIKDLLDYDPHLDLNSSFVNANIPTRLSESENDDMLGDVGLTPLSVVAKTQDNSAFDIIKLLIKHGANPNKVGSGGRTTLGEACRWGNVKMIEHLINQGADMDQSNPAFNDGTSLSIAVIEKQLKTVEFLISRGAAVDRVMTDGRTSLIHALDMGNMAMVEMILKSNLISNFTDMGGFDYQIAQQYQSPGRDVKSIVDSIQKRSSQLKEQEKKKLEEEKQKEEEQFDQSEKTQGQQQQQQRAKDHYEFDRSNIYEEIGSASKMANVPKIRKKKKDKSISDSTAGSHYEPIGAVQEAPQSETGGEPIYSEVKKPKKSRQSRRSGHDPEAEDAAIETSAPDGISNSVGIKIETDDQKILSKGSKPEASPRKPTAAETSNGELVEALKSVSIDESSPEAQVVARAVPAKRKKKVARDEKPPEEEGGEGEGTVARPEVAVTMEGLDDVIVKPRARRRRTRPSVESAVAEVNNHEQQQVLDEEQLQQQLQLQQLQHQQQQLQLQQLQHQQQQLQLQQQQEQQHHDQQDAPNDAVFPVYGEVKVKKRKSKKTPVVGDEQ